MRARLRFVIPVLLLVGMWTDVPGVPAAPGAPVPTRTPWRQIEAPAVPGRIVGIRAIGVARTPLDALFVFWSPQTDAAGKHGTLAFSRISRAGQFRDTTTLIGNWESVAGAHAQSLPNGSVRVAISGIRNATGSFDGGVYFATGPKPDGSWLIDPSPAFAGDASYDRAPAAAKLRLGKQVVVWEGSNAVRAGQVVGTEPLALTVPGLACCTTAPNVVMRSFYPPGLDQRVTWPIVGMCAVKAGSSGLWAAQPRGAATPYTFRMARVQSVGNVSCNPGERVAIAAEPAGPRLVANHELLMMGIDTTAAPDTLRVYSLDESLKVQSHDDLAEVDGDLTTAIGSLALAMSPEMSIDPRRRYFAAWAETYMGVVQLHVARIAGPGGRPDSSESLGTPLPRGFVDIVGLEISPGRCGALDVVARLRKLNGDMGLWHTRVRFVPVKTPCSIV